MSLSDALTALQLSLRLAHERASNSETISRQQQSEVVRLSGEVSKLNSDLTASRISQEQAWQRAQELLAQLQTLNTELIESRKLSGELALETAALTLDRDGWKARAEWQAGLLKWAPWVAAVLVVGGVALGSALW